MPGAFEIPIVVRELAPQKKADAIIAIGVILQGRHHHAEHLAVPSPTRFNRSRSSMAFPVINAVLSLENEEQARERCLEEEINRGTEAARAAVEIANVMADLRGKRRRMGKRRKAREAAIQFHFWRDLQRGETPGTAWMISGIFVRPSRASREFAQPLIDGMVAHLPEIDERISRYCENYEFNRISPVDRNVLRLAIYEMLYRDDIPPVVSINEAIELAKTSAAAIPGVS